MKYNKIQFMTNMKLLHVSTSECHPQGVLLSKGTQSTTLIQSLIALFRIIKISIFWYFNHSVQLNNKRPTWCHLLFYFTSYVFNMFRTLIYPSSGACDCAVELPHRSFCSWLEAEAQLVAPQPATLIPLQPNHTKSPTHIEPRTIRPMW